MKIISHSSPYAYVVLAVFIIQISWHCFNDSLYLSVSISVPITYSVLVMWAFLGAVNTPGLFPPQDYCSYSFLCLKSLFQIFIIYYLNKFIYLFIYFWLHWVFIAARGLSLVVASGGYSLLPCVGFSLQWLLLLQSMGSRWTGFSSCGSRAQWLWLVGSRAQA